VQNNSAGETQSKHSIAKTTTATIYSIPTSAVGYGNRMNLDDT